MARALPRPWPLLFVPFLITLSACGGEEAAPAVPTLRGQSVLYGLLAYDDQLEVVEAPADAPPRQDLMKPARSGQDLYAALPAVIVQPDTVLRYTLPPAPREARLRIALALSGRSYNRGEGEVTLVGRRGQDELFREVLPLRRRTPAKEKCWRVLDVALGSSGPLELEARFEGELKGELLPEVGFGLLQVGVPFELPRTTAAPGRPNVVLVCIDTLRADRLGCQGYEKPVSPHMDALAARGTRFARAQSSGPWTLPGTASVMTGAAIPEHALGASRSFHLSDAHVTLAEALQLQGLTTGAFTCNPLVSQSRNFDQGFESFRNYRWPRAVADPTQIEEGKTPDEPLQDVLAWLREHKDERFFLYFHPVDPHYPYDPLPESRARLVGEAPEGFIPAELRPAAASYYAGEDDPSAARILASNAHQSELYDAEVADIDAALGVLFAELQALGLEDRTLVCVTSDHGEEFLEHGWVGHNAALFEESTHVPLLFAGPGVPVGEVHEFPVENRHLARTLLELARAPVPEGLSGRALFDPAERAALADEPVFTMNQSGVWVDWDARTQRDLGQFHSVLADGWRLIRSGPLPGERLLALFDTRTDPACRNDVSAAHPERTAELDALIVQWLTEGRARRRKQTPAHAETLEDLRGNGYVGFDGPESGER